MSIASEITRLQSAKSTLKTKLNAKNDAQHQITNETIDDYGDFVDSIQTGGSPNLQSKSITITTNTTTNVSADTGYDGLSSVSITTNVSGSNEQLKGVIDTTVVTLDIPYGTTSIASYKFQNCTSLTSVTIPNTVTKLNMASFQNCRLLTKITIPNSVTSIASNVFNGCTGMLKYDFSNLDHIPSLSSTNTFTGINSDCIMVIPDNLYESWKIANVWSNFASYMIKASEDNS